MAFLGKKRTLLAAGAALVLGGSALGVAVAQQTPTPAPTPTPGRTAPPSGQQREQAYQQYLDAVARRLGVTRERLEQALAEARTELGLPNRGPGFRPGFHGRGGFGPGGVDLGAAAQALGISPEQLRQELPGRSLADVARAHNVDPQRVADALKAAANTRIDQAVAAGRIPADQAAQAKQQAGQRIDQLLTRQVPSPGQRPGPRPSPTPGAGTSA